MLGFFKSKKKFLLSDNQKKKIEKEIIFLKHLKEGIFYKCKEFDIGYFINIFFDKRILSIDQNEEKNIPDYINFIIIIGSAYPDIPPHILAKTNFSFPSLVDGRDLLKDIVSNWNKNSTIQEIVNNIPNFIIKVLNSKTYNLFGSFHLGAIYDLKNFNNMSVNTFNCRLDKKGDDNEYTIIISDDCLILFENSENSTSGKVIFWATLFSITDLQVNKVQKVASIGFYNDENISEKQFKFKIDNILFFREALIKRMTTLKIKIDAKKLVKGQPVEKKISEREINTMSINQIVNNINILKQKIDKNEVNYYLVNTFTILCGKAIEFYSAMNDDSHLTYLTMMKEVLSREYVQKITTENN